MEVRDGYAFVADDQMGLTVLDARVLDLGSIEVVGWMDTPGNALAVDLDGDYAYIADKRQGLAIIDISDLTSPAFVSRIDLDGWCMDVEVRDGLAFLVGCLGSISGAVNNDRWQAGVITGEIQ